MLKLESGTQTTEAQVAAFEAHHAIELPKDYRQFLLSCNGGRCVSGGVLREVGTGAKVSRVDRLLGISSISYESLEQSLDALATRVPDKLVPIGEDAGGNCILLDCSVGATRGHIYFLGLERASDDSPPSRGDLPLVAESFSMLLAQMEED